MPFKNHGCCGHIFAALDAIEALRNEHGFAADDVARIEVGGYGPTKTVCDRPDARTAQEARFSVQYCAAALLRLGAVRLAAFDARNLADPAIRADMAKVGVEVDPELADAYPRRRAARVEVVLRDGRSLRHHQPTRRGDPDAPLSDADLVGNFRELASPVIGEGEAARLEEALLRGAALPGPLAPLEGLGTA